MAYEIKRVDVTTLERATILHGVNCQSAMGSGIAGAIARKWPVVREQYLEHIRTHIAFLHSRSAPWAVRGDQSLRRRLLGTVQYVEATLPLTSAIADIVVVNCFTQFNFGGDGQRYADENAIAAALDSVFIDYEFARHLGNDLPPIYLPQIGCGLGGLSWDHEVKPIYDAVARKYPDIDFTVCVL